MTEREAHSLIYRRWWYLLEWNEGSDEFIVLGNRLINIKRLIAVLVSCKIKKRPKSDRFNWRTGRIT